MLSPYTSFDTSTALRIRVSDAATGKSKVNVNIPVGLVRLGLRFIPQSANIDTEKIMRA